jgi:hypothetical protein
MNELACWIVSLVARRLRSRAVLELENLVLRHQLHVLRRQRPGRPRLFAIDRLLWIWLYRIWPRCLDAMVLVKPATVVQWHRQGFRLFWRCVQALRRKLDEACVDYRVATMRQHRSNGDRRRALLWLLGPAFRVKMPLPFLDWAVDKTRPLPGEFKAWSANQSAPQEILREIRRNFAQPVGARSAFNLFGLAENTCSLVEEIFQWLDLHTIRLGSCAS